MNGKHVNKNLSLPEIFAKLKDTPMSIDEKAKNLLVYDSKPMRWFVNLMYNFDFSGIVVPNYIPSPRPIGLDYMTIKTAIPRLEAVLKNKENTKLVERNLRLVLENVHCNEAALLVDLLQGKKIAGVSKSVFARAYPNFFLESDLADV